jgi:hypothetical protein
VVLVANSRIKSYYIRAEEFVFYLLRLVFLYCRFSLLCLYYQTVGPTFNQYEYLGTKLRNIKDFCDEIRERINSRIGCCYSVRKLSLNCIRFKMLKIWINKGVSLILVLYDFQAGLLP